MEHLLSSNLFKHNVFLVGSLLLMRLYKRHTNRKEQSEINELLFMRGTKCCDNYAKNSKCDNEYCYNYIIRRMETLIDGAQHSVYICMNIFTDARLGKVVLRAHQRGVSVKIIGNESTAYASGSQLSKLHRSGIPIKNPTTKGHMHHKFCLIDTDKSTSKKNADRGVIPSDGILMTGSMNWTFQAINQNWENLRITSDKFFVKKLHNEFNAIWDNANVADYRKKSIPTMN